VASLKSVASVRSLRAFSSLTSRAAWQAFVGFWDSDDMTYAASIAYYALLALFPLFLLALVLLGRVTGDVEQRSAVLGFVLRYFPTQFEFITSQIDAFRSSGLTFGVAGTIGLIWGALGLFGAVSTAVNYAWGVGERHSFWHHKLLSFLMLDAAGLILLIALLLVSASQVVGAGWFAGVLRAFPGLAVLRGFTVRYATTLLFVLVVGFVFWAVPNTKVRFRDVWVGALVTGLLWRAATAGFSWFLTDMTQLTLVDGSIAAVVMFLVWVYVQAVIFLYGVEFTAAYAHLRHGRTGTNA
jgi:membrane protein